MLTTRKHTALYAAHLQQHACMVDFAGWQMPLHYGSQIAEHNQVRNAVGMFDVSHMGVIEITGSASQQYLARVLANNIYKLQQPGHALYSCMLNAAGGILDDLIVYFVAENHYRLVVNAATVTSDYAWLQQQAQEHRQQQLGAVDLQLQLRTDLAMLAVQGPQARATLAKIFPTVGIEIMELKPFAFLVTDAYFIARTGYTGEDGVEIILPATGVGAFWNTLLAAHVPPIGLAARDTLRLEAGLNLYGQDMDSNVTPLESNLAWTVAWQPEERNFIGREALQRQQAQAQAQTQAQAQMQTQIQLQDQALGQAKQPKLRQLIGVVLEEKGVLRHGYQLFVNAEPDTSTAVGDITSGSYSPTLKQAIGLARVNTPIKEHYYVEIRGKRMLAKVVKLPFLKKK